MTTATRTRPAASARAGSGEGRSVSVGAEMLRSGIGHSVGVNVISLVVLVSIVVVGWASAGDPASSWRGAASVGGAMWLVAHLVDLSMGLPVAEGGTGPLPVTLSPLGASAVIGALHIRSGRRLARLAGVWGAGAWTLALAVVAGAATTAMTSAAVAAWVAGPAIAVAPLRTAIACAGFAAVAMALGVFGRTGARAVRQLPTALAAHVSRCVPAVLVAVTALLVAGALLVSAGLVMRIATVTDAGTALSPGAFGGFWLVVGQVAVMPNLVVWAGSLLSGAPVQVAEQSIALSGSNVVTAAPLPLFTIMPTAGVWPLWAWCGVAAVVACGALAGWRAHRQPQRPRLTLGDRFADALAVGSASGATVALLVHASSGSLAAWGPVGPSPLVVGAAVAAEVAGGALLAGVALHLTHPRGASTRR